MQFSRKQVISFVIGIGVLALILFGVPTTSFIDSALAQTGVYDTNPGAGLQVVNSGAGCIVNGPNGGLIGALTNLTIAPSVLGFNASGQLVTVDARSAAVVNGVVITTFELTVPLGNKVEVRLNNANGRCSVVDVPDF